jgi:glycosyltransferase involved in cell wall biosynthesis
MRVLAVTNVYPTPQFPASGTFVEQQIKGLRQIGLDVDVIFVDRAQKGVSAYWSLRPQLHARIANFQPDVVHVMYGGVMADTVTRAVDDRPAIVSFCGSDLLGQLLSGPFRKFMSRYGVLASHRAAKRATGVVVKSKNLQDALPDDVNLSKVKIIPNGIDLTRFKPLDREKCRARLGWSPYCFHVLFPTNFGDPTKRPDLAYAAVEIVNRLGIPTELQQLRGVAHDEVPIWLNASDVILLTSKHEGSPNIIKEALACDLPVVSLDVGDVRERIQEVEGCYLALPEPSDLAAKLCLVHAGPGRVAGRTKVQELSLERIALCLKEYYKELLITYRKPRSVPRTSPGCSWFKD